MQRAAAAGIVRVTSRASPQHDRPGRCREAYSAHGAHSPNSLWVLTGLTEGNQQQHDSCADGMWKSPNLVNPAFTFLSERPKRTSTPF